MTEEDRKEVARQMYDALMGHPGSEEKENKDPKGLKE